MAGSGANTVRLTAVNPILGSGRKPTGGSLLKPGYLGGQSRQQPPPLAITSGFGQDRSAASDDRKRKDYGNDGHRGGSGEGERREKRRRSRWGPDENQKTFIPGMPTTLPTNLDSSQEQAYLIQLQIEDFTGRLRSGDLGIPANPAQRSPSPEPIYGSDGKRMNTREIRVRRQLEEQRHNLVQKMIQMNSEYRPPADYRPPSSKMTEKICIPQEEHPDINFVGLLIGPRGNTLKALERDTGARIVIRGKGSVKEGKVGRRDGQAMPGEDEPLHALVSAVSSECVRRAVNKITEIIKQAVELPDGENDLRKSQLRELALLNGTLRDQDGPRCANCGADNHKTWQCQDKPNVTKHIICTSCGSAGHVSGDCRQRRPGTHVYGNYDNSSGGGYGGEGPEESDQGYPTAVDRGKIDEEYMSLMAELGEAPPPPPPPPRNGAGAARGYGAVQRPPFGNSGGFGGGGAGGASGGGGQRWTAPPPQQQQRPGLLNHPPPSSNSQPPPSWGGAPHNQGPAPAWGGAPSQHNQGPMQSHNQGPPPAMGQRPPPPMGQGPPTMGQGYSQAFHQGPPPSSQQGPPQSGHQGPPPTSAAARQPSFSSAPPTMFRATPPNASQSTGYHAGQAPSTGQPQNGSGGGGGGWQAPWQQPPPPGMDLGAPPGSQPLGQPPPVGLPPWHPQYGAPPQRGRPLGGMGGMGMSAGLPNLLAAPPPPPGN